MRHRRSGDVHGIRPHNAAVLLRRIRLAAGLVLLAYLATHLLNHALGLISLATMEAGRTWFLAFWRNPVGTLALYGALAAHVALALWSLYQRRSLRMPAWEAAQLFLGLMIPPLLVSHVVGTRLAHAWFDTTDSYTRVVLALWEQRPLFGVRQALVLAIAWTHGCIGLHFWLRLRPWYPRVAPVLLSTAVLLPVLALLGFAHAGREVAALARQPDWVAEVLRSANAPGPAARVRLEHMHSALLAAFVASLGAVLLARAARLARARRRGSVRFTYPDGRLVLVPRGLTVLEASRSAGIPHASVCGGRGRCSTCRVRISRGLESLPTAMPEELRVLKRVGAPPNVRLACQLRPTHDLSIVPLLPATASARDGIARPGYIAGQDREIAVLFADLRRFTALAERRLPYDVVFLLNRYCEAVGTSIEGAGGVPNQFTGDGVMALFGVETGPDNGCRCALIAAHEIVRSLDALSQTLAEELDAPLQVGIGIHAGPAIIGQMGYGAAVYLTAVGDTVNVASRLQELTKQYDCQLVISEQVVRRAGVDGSLFPRHQVMVRNHSGPLVIYTIDHVAGVTQLLSAAPLLEAPESSLGN
jgi:adenylate cyclase